MTTAEALVIVEGRGRPKEDDWDLLEAAEVLAVAVHQLTMQCEAFQAALDGGPDPRKG